MVTDTPYPDAPGQAGNIKNMSALLGIGAYQIDDATAGSGTNFGQDITGEDFVKSFVYSTAMNMGAGDGSIASALTNLGTYLNTMSLDALKLLQPFIPGATNDQFNDTATAVETIINQFNVAAMLSIEDFNNWVTSLLDPNSALWQDAKDKWDALMAQLSSYPAAGASPATVATWWSTLLIDLGGDPTLSASIANVISGNYDAAKTARAWWDQLLTSLGIGSGTAVGTLLNGHGLSIADQQTWWNTFSNAFWVSLDWFHIYFPVGSPSDTATTTSGGKMTWYASQAAMKALFTTIGLTPPVVAHVDVAGVIVGNADAVNQGITGTSVTGAGAAQVASSVGGLQQTVAALQDQVGALVAPALSPTTILSDDGKSSPGAGLGSNWTRSGVNVIIRDATYGFGWPVSGSSARTELGMYNTPLATTDQVGEIVLNHMMAYDPFNADPENAGIPYNQIILRGNSATPTSYVFARIRSNHVQFGYAASGVEHLLGSPTTLRANSASGYRFYAGDDTSDYHFRLDYNGRTVATYDDSSGHASIASIAGKYTGQSWTSAPYSYGGEGEPAYTSWRSWDATASAGVPPGFGHVTRVSATGVTMTSGFLPYTFFDTTVGTLGSGITLPVSGNAGLIVGSSGLYTVSYGLRMSSTANATDVYPGIAVNGTVQETSTTFMYDGGGTLLNGGQFSMSSGSVLCTAGDLLSPWMGVQSGGGGSGLTGAGGSSWNGDSSGSRAFFKVAKLG
jgi:hypothetical protein